MAQRFIEYHQRRPESQSLAGDVIRSVLNHDKFLVCYRSIDLFLGIYWRNRPLKHDQLYYQKTALRADLQRRLGARRPILQASRMIKHAGRWVLGIGAHDSVFTVFDRFYGQIKAT